jgi:hypothetical protein
MLHNAAFMYMYMVVVGACVGCSPDFGIVTAAVAYADRRPSIGEVLDSLGYGIAFHCLSMLSRPSIDI